MKKIYAMGFAFMFEGIAQERKIVPIICIQDCEWTEIWGDDVSIHDFKIILNNLNISWHDEGKNTSAVLSGK